MGRGSLWRQWQGSASGRWVWQDGQGVGGVEDGGQREVAVGRDGGGRNVGEEAVGEQEWE